MLDLQIASFWTDNRTDILVGVGTLLAALILAEVVDHALKRRKLSAVTETRLRLVRRLIFAAIMVVGVGLALSQIEGFNQVAAGLLASSAVLGLVVGFAARQTLANAIAGLLIALSQPIRIGDLVTFEEETGVVEDIRLTYTYIRCDDGRRLIVPNERLAQSSLHNHTVVDPRVQVVVDFWIAHGVDTYRAMELISEDPGVEASVAEIAKEGVRLTATTWADNPRERGAVAARLRAKSLDRLRVEGLSSDLAAQ